MSGNSTKSPAALPAILKGDPAALIQSALREYAEALDGGRFVVEAKQGEIRVEALERK
ncbi:MAG TPA: hypothetical protein VI382_07595 [Candidatus Manganitrophaceae bacterium]|nr:hypothetical protein [Candidatus Manganitrophaceae bacterium]